MARTRLNTYAEHRVEPAAVVAGDEPSTPPNTRPNSTDATDTTTTHARPRSPWRTCLVRCVQAERVTERRTVADVTEELVSGSEIGNHGARRAEPNTRRPRRCDPADDCRASSSRTSHLRRGAPWPVRARAVARRHDHVPFGDVRGQPTALAWRIRGSRTAYRMSTRKSADVTERQDRHIAL